MRCISIYIESYAIYIDNMLTSLAHPLVGNSTDTGIARVLESCPSRQPHLLTP